MSQTGGVNSLKFYDADTLTLQVESAALLRHSYDIESRDMAGVNLRAFPISSVGAVTEERPTSLPRMADPERVPERTTSAVPYDPDRVDANDDDFVELTDDEVVVIYNSEEELLNPHRQHDVFPDPARKAHPDEIRLRKRRAICNIILIAAISLLSGVGFLLYCVDILLLNIGDVTWQRICFLTVLSLSIASTAFSHVTINVIGYKWSLFNGCLGISVFTASKFFSWTPLFVTSSIICGLTLGPLAVATVTCALNVSRDYAALTGIEVKVIVCYLDAVLNFGTLLSPAISVLLRLAFLPSEWANSFQNEDRLLDCYRDFCWTDQSGLSVYEVTGSGQRSSSQWLLRQALLGSYLACSLSGALLAWIEARHWTDSLETSGSDLWITVPDPESVSRTPCTTDWKSCESYSVLLKETTAVLCNNLMLLLLLLCTYLGVQQYLMYSIFLQTYSQCSGQMFHALMVALNLSLIAAFCSLPTAPIIARLGRFKVVTSAVVMQLVLLIVLLASKQLHVSLHYVIATFWGVADGVLHNVLIVIVFEVFREKADVAVVCLKSCQFTGYLITAGLQLFQLCNYAILLFAVSLLLLAFLCYCILEIRIRVDKRSASLTTHYVPLLAEASWLPHVSPVLVRRETRQPISTKVKSFGYD